VPDPVLTLLKYVFLAILYLFFLRVLRAVWVETREPKAAPLPAPAAPVAAGAPATPASGPPGPERMIVIDPDAMKGMEFALGSEVTVGRAGGCAILLSADTFVSQLHARVFRQGKDLYVEDLGSTNGTYVNDRKVTSPVAIRKGDKVKFGRTTLEVVRK
jgi:pSer/pThr/pTyr-binding forkhead associated (FHA) protein